MKSYLHFLQLCLKWAFLHWRLVNPVMSPVVFSVVFYSSLFITGSGMAIYSQNPLWLSVTIPMILIMFLAAPYYVWKGERERADTVEESIKPKISVMGKILSGDPSGLSHHTVCIMVVNQGISPIVGCTGLLHAVYREVGHDLIPLDLHPIYLQWSPRSGGKNGRAELSFNEEAVLDVAYRNNGRLPEFMILTFDYKLRDEYYLDDYSSYIFDIGIASANSSPVRCKYRLTMTELPPKDKHDYYTNRINPPVITFEVIKSL